jgi:hypothetical protein
MTDLTFVDEPGLSNATRAVSTHNIYQIVFSAKTHVCTLIILDRATDEFVYSTLMPSYLHAITAANAIDDPDHPLDSSSAARSRFIAAGYVQTWTRNQ